MYSHRVRLYAQSICLRIVLALLAAGIIAGIFAGSLSVKRVSDMVRPLMHVTPQQISQFGPYVTLVQAGLHITNVLEFSTQHKRFYFDGVIWFEYDPREVSLETLGKFAIADAFIRVRSEPDVRMIGPHRALASWRVTVRMMLKLHFDDYPYEGHRIAIMLTNPSVTPGELMFAVSRDGFTFESDLLQSEWRVQKGSLATQSGYTRAFLDASDKDKIVSNPQAMFSFTCLGMGKKGTIVIFLPLLFALLLGLFGLLIPYRQGGDSGLAWGAAMTSITSVLGYRFVLQSMMPNVQYMTLADWFYMLVLIGVFIPFLYQVLLAIFTRKRVVNDADAVMREESVNLVNVMLFVLLAAGAIVWLILLLF